MQGVFIVVTNKETLANAHDLIDEANNEGWFKMQIKKGGARSLPQNDLFHQWCRAVAKFLKLKGLDGITPEEQAKLVFKEMFLGREDIVVTKSITLKDQLRHTSKLDKAEMHHFMSQVESWCADKGLPLASTGEYREYKEAQIK
jgi:hypothetical protein